MASSPKTTAQIFSELSERFDPSEVRWKPQSVSGNRALALAYIDARCVQDRLDEVIGHSCWSDSYEVLADGSVVCKLSLKIDGDWLVKMDVGSQSEQPDGGDRMKAAFSDSLKRAAVKFGIGRYLHKLPMQWVDYDPVKRQFVRQPQLPQEALPIGYKYDQAQAAPPPVDARQASPATPMPKATDPLPPRPGENDPITHIQLDAIGEFLKELEKDYAWLATSISKRFGTTEVRQLKAAQADDLIIGLSKMRKDKK